MTDITAIRRVLEPNPRNDFLSESGQTKGPLVVPGRGGLDLNVKFQLVDLATGVALAQNLAGLHPEPPADLTR